MLHLSLSPHHLHKLIETHPKQNDYFLIQQNELRTVEQLIDDIVHGVFHKNESLVVILLKKVLVELLHSRLDAGLVQEIFQLLKQYETDLRLYRQHYFDVEKLIFEKDNQQNQLNQLKKNDYLDQSMVNYSIIADPPQQNPDHNITIQISPSADRNSKSLIYDIECYSEDSKHNFLTNYDDKYFCSEYLTTSEDEKQHTTRSTIIQQLKQQLQHKLKIQPHVSAFTFSLKPKTVSLDFEQELLDWKRTRCSIMQEHSLQKAISPKDLDESDFIYRMKQNHYRQKIKSAIVKRRLCSKHLST